MISKKNYLILFLFLSLMPLRGNHSNIEVGIRTLKVATWNIEHLRSKNNQGAVKRSDDDYERLKRYAEILDADIIALQEVDGAEAASRVFDPTLYKFYFSNRNNKMRTGFAVKKDLVVIHHPDYTALDVNGNKSLRFGTDITVIHDHDSLRLMSLHLKSTCWAKPLGGTNNSPCEKLERQMNALEEWIDDRAIESIPFLVLGDFNRRFDAPGDEFWPSIDDGVPLNSDLLNVTEGIQSECWNGEYPLFIDHIVLDRRATELLIEGSMHQLCYDIQDEIFKDKLSDHCPISIELKIGSPAVEPCSCEEISALKERMKKLEEQLERAGLH